MRRLFFSRLAWTGIRKNRRLYLPYILTCAGMVMMFYIVASLSENPLLDEMSGGGNVRVMLTLGRWVVAVFSLVFLFYTHSFLIRRRNREFGLYNVLGMDKRGIGRIILCECGIVSAINLVSGLALGVAFSKFAELGLLNVLKQKIDFGFRLSVDALLLTLGVFAGIFALILLNSLRLVRKSDPLSLMRSESAGEKPPRANWVLAGLGVLLVGAAYYLAVSIQSPLSALLLFFVAVIMVILGTYLLMIAGSVALCRFLQGRRGYYYKPRHFVSVSAMAYRMRRNGAGLASICILCTMVLVMISSTTSLYIGEEDILRTRYRRDVETQINVDAADAMDGEAFAPYLEAIAATAAAKGISAQNALDYRSASIAGVLQNGSVHTDSTTFDSDQLLTYDDMVSVYIVPIEDYRRVTGDQTPLKPGETLLYCGRMAYDSDQITIANAPTLKIVGKVDFELGGNAAMVTVPTLCLFVPDFFDYIAPLTTLTDIDGYRLLTLSWYQGFDVAGDDALQLEIYMDLCLRVADVSKTDAHCTRAFVDNAAANRSDFFTAYGGLFFIGIILSLVFSCAAILIIYYKQVSEGYEDQPRFEIMQKVGMSRRDIRRSINSQILTVFYAPLVLAGLHLAFAFPMIWKLLQLFGMHNLTLFVLVTLGAYLLFALIYAVVYRLTSNSYYSIVSGAKED